MFFKKVQLGFWVLGITCIFFIAQANQTDLSVPTAQETQKKLEASLSSPIPSTYLELGIPNTHEVLKVNGVGVFRGMRPRSEEDFKKITESGISHVIAFRLTSDTAETSEQFAQHVSFGLKQENLHYIAFPWRRMGGFEENCKKVLEAINIIEKSTRAGQRVFFHCTVGEDRTGALAGLLRIKYQSWSPLEAFEKELCARGFSRANPQKPEHVSMAIERELQPFFFKMAYLLKNNKTLSSGSICKSDPALTMAYAKWLVGEDFRAKKCLPLEFTKKTNE